MTYLLLQFVSSKGEWEKNVSNGTSGQHQLLLYLSNWWNLLSRRGMCENGQIHQNFALDFLNSVKWYQVSNLLSNIKIYLAFLNASSGMKEIESELSFWSDGSVTILQNHFSPNKLNGSHLKLFCQLTNVFIHEPMSF